MSESDDREICLTCAFGDRWYPKEGRPYVYYCNLWVGPRYWHHGCKKWKPLSFRETNEWREEWGEN